MVWISKCVWRVGFNMKIVGSPVLSWNISFSPHILVLVTTRRRVPQPWWQHMDRGQQCWSMQRVTKWRYTRQFRRNYSITLHCISLNDTLTQHKTSHHNVTTTLQYTSPDTHHNVAQYVGHASYRITVRSQSRSYKHYDYNYHHQYHKSIVKCFCGKREINE